MCIQGSQSLKLAWCEPDVYIFLPTVIVLRRRDTIESTVFDRMLPVDDNDLPFNYQGPGVLCALTIGISAVDYFFCFNR